MSAFDPIDSWFDKGFKVKKTLSGSKTKRDKIRGAGVSSRGGGGGGSMSSARKAANIKAVIKKAPEVMVKITGSSNGMKSAKNHLSYIARNGEVELETETGELINGREELRGLREAYKSEQIPLESKRREFLHVVFSMPAGTDAKGLKTAVANFCKDEFSNRRYVMALHDDKAHTHIHLCVQTRDKDRADEPRLSPRKNDLARWRMGFAEQLREQGIDAAASDRKHRFKHQKSENSVLRQIRADNPNSKVFDETRANAKADKRLKNAIARPETAFVGAPRPPRTPNVYEKLNSELTESVKTKKRPDNPALDKIENNRANALKGWEAVERNLANASDAESKELAKLLRDLIDDGKKPITSRNQDLYDNLENKENQLDKDIKKVIDTEIER